MRVIVRVRFMSAKISKFNRSQRDPVVHLFIVNLFV